MASIFYSPAALTIHVLISCIRLSCTCTCAITLSITLFTSHMTYLRAKWFALRSSSTTRHFHDQTCLDYLFSLNFAISFRISAPGSAVLLWIIQTKPRRASVFLYVSYSTDKNYLYLKIPWYSYLLHLFFIALASWQQARGITSYLLNEDFKSTPINNDRSKKTRPFTRYSNT